MERSESQSEDLLTAWTSLDKQKAAASATNLLHSGSVGLLRSSQSLNHLSARRSRGNSFLNELQGAVAIGASPIISPTTSTANVFEDEDDFHIGEAHDTAPIEIHKLNNESLKLR